MKIVHVMNWYIPGMGYQENYLPAEQKKLGHTVEIITGDRLPPHGGFKNMVGSFFKNRLIGTGTCEDNGVIIHRLPSIEIKGQLILKGLNKKLKEVKPDIIQIHGVFLISTAQVIICYREHGPKIFVDSHLHYNNFKVESFLEKIYVSAFKLFYKRYEKRVVCFMPVTYAAKQILQSLLKIPDEKIELLHLGADTSHFKKLNELKNIGRREIGIKDDEILIISAGKFDKCKDAHILIEAFQVVACMHPNAKLLLVGSGPKDYMEKLRSMVKDFGLNEKIIFKDFAPHSYLLKYYSAADIGVWPGDHSITTLEAISTGLPVIIPTRDTAYKVLFDYNAAIGFERGDVISLSNKIIRLIHDRQLRHVLAANSISLVSNVLAWEKIAEKSISIYRKGEV